MSKPVLSGAAFLREMLSEFRFTEAERGLSVAVSAMLTLFARRLLPPLAYRPAFVYLANAAGGGKTLLADCAIAPVFGSSPRTPYPQREEEREKLILAEIMSGSETLLFDNVRGRVESPSIENLLTSHVFRGRILNQSKSYEGENHLTLFFTGNGLKVTEDLSRRALFVELFQPEARAQDRQFTRPLSAGWLVEHRREVLAALWQIVQAWDRAGRPKGCNTHASFPEWSAIIGGMVEHAGFASPVAAPRLRDGGNVDAEEMAELVGALRTKHGSGRIDFQQLSEVAADRGLFERITDCKSAAAMERSDKARFGALLKGYDGRTFGEERLAFSIIGKGHQRRFCVTRSGEASSDDGAF
jgi:hypothetical protein